MLTPTEAEAILARCNANADFHTLSTSVIESLLEEADKYKYRKPKNAPGSRARMFHQYLERRAESLTGQAQESVKGRCATVTLTRGRRSVTVSGFED